MAYHPRVLLIGITLLLALFTPVAAHSQTAPVGHKHIARHAAAIQQAPAADSSLTPSPTIETTQAPEAGNWLAAFILIQGWLLWGGILFLIFHRRDADRSTAWKIRRYLFVLPALFCVCLAFWPITLIYFGGRCWNCKKWGHYARNCPEHFRCWSCGELGHHARFCPKGPTERQRWTFIPNPGSLNSSNTNDNS